MKRTELRITAGGWDGIFLMEEEAALALAGRPLPGRVLEHPNVSTEVRIRAASDPEFRKELLEEGASKVIIAFWNVTSGIFDSTGNEEMLTSVTVELYRYGRPEQWPSTLSMFRVTAGGRSYNMNHTSALIDCLQLAYRLAGAATYYIENRILAEKIAWK